MDDSTVASRAVDDAVTGHFGALQPVYSAYFGERARRWRSDAFVIEEQCPDGKNMNAAARVTEPSLTLIQQFCYREANLDGILIPCLVMPEDFSITRPESRVRHKMFDNDNCTDLPFVSSIFRNRAPTSEKTDVLIVLTGNGNDRYLRSSSYHYIIVVTWKGDHKKAPYFLPEYLLALKEGVSSSFRNSRLVGVDVLGLSRGHCALMSCCKQGNGMRHIELACAFRWFLGAGGCIWEGGDKDIVKNVVDGLLAMKEV